MYFQQYLTVASGENRHAIHRSQRWYDATEKALGYTVGPEVQSNLETRERLGRPLVKVYQRHPGTNLPEAQDIIKVCRKLFKDGPFARRLQLYKNACTYYNIVSVKDECDYQN